MFGGMMMKYSCLAQKLPLTLKHNNDSDDLLINQKELQIEYSNFDELIKDIDLLLTDDEYLKNREKKLVGSVITEERFVNNLYTALYYHRTDQEHVFNDYDTSKFRNEYLERFKYFKSKLSLFNEKNIGLIKYFPFSISISFIIKIFKKIGGKLN